MPDTLITCPEDYYYVTPTEVNGVAIDCTGLLRQGEVLIGTPVLTATGITVSSPAVNTAVLFLEKQRISVEPGKAVTFTVTGGTAGNDYIIKVSCGTSASRTREVYVILKVRVPTVAAP